MEPMTTFSAAKDPVVLPGRQNILFLAGIASSFLYFAMNIFIPFQFEGYNSASQTVSELSAVDAPTRSVWLVFGYIYTALLIAFALGVWKSGSARSPLRQSGNFLLAYGIVSLGWPFAPMHLREVLAAGGATVSDTIHLVLAGTTVILMLLAMGFGAAAFRKRFRMYTITSMVILLIFGILTSIEAPNIDANLPTPMIGVWERINIGVFLLWIIVLAVILIKDVKSTRRKIQF